MISIIVPTLNEEKFLPRLLAQFTPAVRNQFRLEVIVTDGGSTDKTLAIAKKYKAHVVTKRLDTPQTIAGGRNSGAWQARGEILVFLDADGYIKNVIDFFSRIKAEMRRQNVVAATVRIEVDPQERRWYDNLWSYFFDGLFFLENKIAIGGMGRGNCQIVKTSAFRQLGGYNENLVAAEDYDLYHRLAKIGNIKFFWDLVVYESPRRFRKNGYLKVVWLWTLNSFSVFFTKKAWSTKWKRV
ncbi:MAG: glycosyltransferase [Patescibacteria group bacterium]